MSDEKRLAWIAQKTNWPYYYGWSLGWTITTPGGRLWVLGGEGMEGPALPLSEVLRAQIDYAMEEVRHDEFPEATP